MILKMKLLGAALCAGLAVTSPLSTGIQAMEVRESTLQPTVDSTAEESISFYVSDDPDVAQSIPRDYLQEYQLPEGKWKIKEGNSVTLDSSGLVQPAVSLWYKNGNVYYSYPTGEPGEVEIKEYVTGTSTIEGSTSAGEACRFTVTVYDYGLDVQAEEILENLKKELIQDGMSKLQILDAGCQMAARQKYDASYSDWKSMLLYGGGDCWASSDLILKICKDYGIEAKIRNANRDPGAGSGHKNVIAWIDGKVYLADAGYADEHSPRTYQLCETSEYSYRIENDQAYIYQYDGREPVMNIPSVLNGTEVAGLDSGSVNSEVEKVVLPAGVKTIDSRAFVYASDLKTVEVNADQKNFSTVNGDLYNKDKTKLILHPAASAKEEVVLESGVKTIGSYAFYQDDQAVYTKTIIIPSSLAILEDYAFAGFNGEKIHFEGFMPSFGKQVFAGCSLVVEHDVEWPDTGSIDLAQAESVTFEKTGDGSSQIEVESKEMYRLYNPNSGEHFYTARAAERDHLVSLGWKAEGIGWIAPSASNTPVYRVYNPNAGDHHYTSNQAERDHLVSLGWNDEGIGWYSDDAKEKPVYRQYNPNAKAGAHNYTTNKAESEMLVKKGWKDEGIGWYGRN